MRDGRGTSTSTYTARERQGRQTAACAPSALKPIDRLPGSVTRAWEVRLEAFLHGSRKVRLAQIIAAETPLTELVVLLPHSEGQEAFLKALDAVATPLDVGAHLLLAPTFAALPTQGAEERTAGVARQLTAGFEMIPRSGAVRAEVADEVADTLALEVVQLVLEGQVVFAVGCMFPSVTGLRSDHLLPTSRRRSAFGDRQEVQLHPPRRQQLEQTLVQVAVAASATEVDDVGHACPTVAAARLHAVNEALGAHAPAAGDVRTLGGGHTSVETDHALDLAQVHLVISTQDVVVELRDALGKLDDLVLLAEAAFVEEVRELTDVHVGQRTSFGDVLHILEGLLCLPKRGCVNCLLRLVHLDHVGRLGVTQRVDLRNVQWASLVQALPVQEIISDETRRTRAWSRVRVIFPKAIRIPATAQDSREFAASMSS